MTEYRRARVPGATWFFTVGLAERHGNRLLTERIDALRLAFRTVRERHPFRMKTVVIMPDHLHCVWSLPEGDADYPTRWGLIINSILVLIITATWDNQKYLSNTTRIPVHNLMQKNNAQ